MQSRSRRLVALVGLAVGGGFLLSSPNSGCMSFMGESTATYADFCFIFDCQNGILSGTIDPCSGDRPLFADCPEAEP